MSCIVPRPSLLSLTLGCLQDGWILWILLSNVWILCNLSTSPNLRRPLTCPRDPPALCHVAWPCPWDAWGSVHFPERRKRPADPPEPSELEVVDRQEGREDTPADVQLTRSAASASVVTVRSFWKPLVWNSCLRSLFQCHWGLLWLCPTMQTRLMGVARGCLFQLDIIYIKFPNVQLSW